MMGEVRIMWMWVPDERKIWVRVSDAATGTVEVIAKSYVIEDGTPIRAVVERLFEGLERIGYTHGDSRAEVIASAKVGFEALGLVWDSPADGERVLQ